MGILSTGFTILSAELAAGAVMHGDWSEFALTVAGGVVGVVSIIRDFNPVDAADAEARALQRPYVQSAPEPKTYQPKIIVRDKNNLFEGIGASDPLDDEEPSIRDDFRKGKDKS